MHQNDSQIEEEPRSAPMNKWRLFFMSRLTVSDIMTQIAATVNQEATAPSDGSSEWELWLQYINRGVFEWAMAGDWEVLRKRFYPSVSGVSLATIALPLDFDKLAGTPILYDGTSSTGTPYPEVIEEQRGMYNTDDNYVHTTGNLSNGFSLVFHPGTVASGASIEILYYALPTALASSAQIPLVPNSQFLVDRTIAYIFEARSDSRFQLQEQKARERLLQMIEDNDDSKFNSYSNPSYQRTPERKQGFRVGRD